MKETPEETIFSLERIDFFDNMRTMSRDQQYNVCKRIADEPLLAPCAQLVIEKVAQVVQNPQLLRLLERDEVEQ